jgi:hypothetical protein
MTDIALAEPLRAFSVWVGGVEANDHYLTLPEAEALKDYYVSLGYDDVAVEQLPEGAH